VLLRQPCSGCPDGKKVRFIGNGSANYVTINNINEPKAGTYKLTISYCLDGSRTFDVSVNGGAGTSVALTGTSWQAPAQDTMTVSLNAGANSIRFANSTAYAPDLAEITVAAAGA
jgi:hypothetical protein